MSKTRVLKKLFPICAVDSVSVDNAALLPSIHKEDKEVSKVQPMSLVTQYPLFITYLEVDLCDYWQAPSYDEFTDVVVKKFFHNSHHMCIGFEKCTQGMDERMCHLIKEYARFYGIGGDLYQ